MSESELGGLMVSTQSLDQRTVKGAHLVGSVNLADADAVFRLAADVLGGHLRRIPDGETGERSLWLMYTERAWLHNPCLAVVPPEGDLPWPHVKLRAGADPASITFPSIGYLDSARRSFERFSALQDEGSIPGDTRFQVCVATPMASLVNFVTTRSQAVLEAPYERALLSEVRRICAELPAESLSIQWDLCQEILMWDGYYVPYFDDAEDGIIERVVRLGQAVPEPVELGFHLCYGDYQHRHWQEPADLGSAVEISNRVAAAMGRPLNWIHMPVPTDRTDAAYYEPLATLVLPPETELYLGVVHETDPEDVATARAELARKHAPRDFGVATECGMGRCESDDIHRLMLRHAALSEPVR